VAKTKKSKKSVKKINKKSDAKKLIKKRVKKVVKKTAKKAAKKAAKKVVKKTAKKKVLPIPKGYNTITPYLIVNGALDAIAFYKKALGAKMVMCMNQGKKKVSHAELQIGDTKIMLADEFPEMGAHGPKSYDGSAISIHLYVKNVDATVKKAVSSGAKLLRPVEDQFYGDRSGAVVDPFGHVWYVATHVEDVSPKEMKKRMAAMCTHKPGTCDGVHA